MGADVVYRRFSVEQAKPLLVDGIFIDETRFRNRVLNGRQ
jgi:hypothetical protein